MTWYEAQIYCDLNTERVGVFFTTRKKPQSKHVQAALIAKQNQTVLGNEHGLLHLSRRPKDYYRHGHSERTGFL